MELLENLENKGFIDVVADGRRKKYSATSPHVVVEKAKSVLSGAKSVLPDLLSQQKMSQPQHSIRTLEGEEGLSACFLDVVTSLDKGDVFYRISSAKDQTYVDSLVPAEYRPLRDAKQLERQVITSRQVGSQKKSRLERSIRYLDKSDEVFEHNVIQFIYGDTISLLDFNNLTGTIIKNKAIADFQKSLFSTLYKRLER
jgi:sugar-specific transcriptional regulator TrmB